MARFISGVRALASSRSIKSRAVISSSLRSATVAIAETLVLDTFVDANSTALDAHTPNVVFSGGYTQTASNSFYIQNNKLEPNRYTNKDTGVIEVGVPNFTIEATVTPFHLGSGGGAERGDPGFVFRYTDVNNYWYVYPESDGPWIIIAKVEKGVTTTEMLMRSTKVASGLPVTLRIDCMYQNITLWVNGEEVVTITGGFNMNATKAGIYVRATNSPSQKCTWSSFKVTSYRGLFINWPIFTKKSTDTPLIALVPATWESGDINDPSVQWDAANNRWVNAYTAVAVGDEVQHLGIAYATSLLGPWTKEATNPVLQSNPGDEFGMNGGLIRFKNKWWYYYGSNNSTRTSVASSDDLLTWTKHGIVLQINPNSGEWDQSNSFDCMATVSEDGLTLTLWHAGKNSGVVTGTGYATSTDGLNFTKFEGNPLVTPPEFSIGNHGEPDAHTPTGRGERELLLTWHGAHKDTPTTRFIWQGISFDKGVTWHYCTKALRGSGSGWESVQVFDPCVIRDTDGKLYLFYGGAPVTGNVLGIDIQIGAARTDYKFLGFTR